MIKSYTVGGSGEWGCLCRGCLYDAAMRIAFESRYNWVATQFIEEFEDTDPRICRNDIIPGFSIALPEVNRNFTFKTTWHDSVVDSKITGIVVTTLAHLSVFAAPLMDTNPDAQKTAEEQIKGIAQYCSTATADIKRAWDLVRFLADEKFGIRLQDRFLHP